MGMKLWEHLGCTHTNESVNRDFKCVLLLTAEARSSHLNGRVGSRLHELLDLYASHNSRNEFAKNRMTNLATDVLARMSEVARLGGHSTSFKHSRA